MQSVDPLYFGIRRQTLHNIKKKLNLSFKTKQKKTLIFQKNRGARLTFEYTEGGWGVAGVKGYCYFHG